MTDQRCHHHYPYLLSHLCLECGNFVRDEECEPQPTGANNRSYHVTWTVNQ